MAQRVYVHIGAHKSASSTLQRNLNVNRELLAQRGIWYIPPADIATSDLGSYFRLLASGSEDRLDLDSAKAALAEFACSTPHNDFDLLLSWEGILGHSSLDRYHGIYPHAAQVADSVRQIFEDFDYRLLFVTRRQDDFIESSYLQQIKERRTVQFPDFIKELDLSRLSWYRILNSLGATCGLERVVVVPFELIKHVGAAGFVATCLEVLTGRKGLANDFDWNEQANVSMSGPGLELALQGLPLLENDVKKTFVRFILKNLSTRTHEKAQLLDPLTRRLLVSHCHRDNALLIEKYMARFLSSSDEREQKSVLYYFCDEIRTNSAASAEEVDE